MANTLVLIGVLAAGMTAMRNGSDLATRAIFTLTLGILLVGLLGSIVCRRHAAWVGFALFGWAYLIATCVPPMAATIRHRLLTEKLLEIFVEHMYEIPPSPGHLLFPVEQHGNSYMKVVDGQRVPLTAAETKAFTDFTTQVNDRNLRINAMGIEIQNAQQIGAMLVSLIFALVGAGVGQFLAARCRPSATH
jgi:hypothetical protein